MFAVLKGDSRYTFRSGSCREGLTSDERRTFSKAAPQRSASTTVTSPEATSDTLLLVKAAIIGVYRIWLPKYRYGRAGLITALLPGQPVDPALGAHAPLHLRTFGDGDAALGPRSIEGFLHPFIDRIACATAHRQQEGAEQDALQDARPHAVFYSGQTIFQEALVLPCKAPASSFHLQRFMPP